MTGPLLASVDPVTKRLPPATEATYAVALLKGQPNGVAEYDNDGDLVNAAGSKIVPTAGVALNGNQIIAGTKTFTSAPAVPDASFAIAKVNGLAAALDGRATETELSDGLAAVQAAGEIVVEYTSTASPARPSTGGKTVLWKSTKFPGAAAPASPMLGDTRVKHPNDY